MRIAEIQQKLVELNLDGWLLYDFFGSNPIARAILNFDEHTTRRWFVFIPNKGSAAAIVPKLESSQFQKLAAVQKIEYRTWAELHAAIGKVVPPRSRIAMEYAPENAIPYISRVDAGTIELVKRITSAEILTSAELVQEFQSRWGADGLKLHLAATQIVYGAARECFEFARREMLAGRRINEYDLQQRILAAMRSQGIVGAGTCIVSVGPNAGLPHYAPTKDKFAGIGSDSVLLFDVWGKLPDPGAIYTDMTFMAYTGVAPGEKVLKVWRAVSGARDDGIEFIKLNFKSGALRGCDVDDVVRARVVNEGFGEFFVHRTGHSIQTEDHANGVNLDNFETKDTRRLISDIGFSIEPGIYLPEFGMRSEVVMYIDPAAGPTVTTPIQKDLWLF